jgi:hypothetical protein
LLNIIASLKLVPECKGEEFMTCTFTKNENGGGTFVADDGNENVLYTQEVEFTDFPEDEVKLFFIDNMPWSEAKNIDIHCVQLYEIWYYDCGWQDWPGKLKEIMYKRVPQSRPKN